MNLHSLRKRILEMACILQNKQKLQCGSRCRVTNNNIEKKGQTPSITALHSSVSSMHVFFLQCGPQALFTRVFTKLRKQLKNNGTTLGSSGTQPTAMAEELPTKTHVLRNMPFCFLYARLQMLCMLCQTVHYELPAPRAEYCNQINAGQRYQQSRQ